jgi:type I restriction enzyme S subunit
MAKFNSIRYSELENNSRIESEFYMPNYMAIEKLIKSTNFTKLLIASTKITDGTHFTPKYVDNGVKFYSALNVLENYFNHTDKHKHITIKEHKVLYNRCNPKAGDILLRKVGVGARHACVIPEGLPEFSIFVSLALIKLKKGIIDPYYLSTFINSKYGQSQLLRIQKGASQPDLHLEDIALLKVPLLEDHLQKEIALKVIEANRLVKQSQLLYKQATDLLELELGLDKINFEKPKSYIAKFNEVIKSRRADAEFYNTYYEPLLNRILGFKNGYSLLRSITTKISANVEVNKLNTTHFNYVEIGDINVSNGYFDFKLIETKDAPANAKIKLRGGELLVSLVRPTRGAISIVPDNLPKDDTICSGAFYVFQVKNKVYREIVWLYLRSIKMIFEKFCGGTSYPTLDEKYLSNFPIPNFDNEIAQKISTLILESSVALNKSKILLVEAKARVEQLIEEAAQN